MILDKGRIEFMKFVKTVKDNHVCGYKYQDSHTIIH